MSKEQINVKYPLNAVPLAKFAELIGKSHEAVKQMAKYNKIPTIEFRDPEKPKSRAGEIWVSLSEFNRGMDEAFYSRTEEQRKTWLLWVGL